MDTFSASKYPVIDATNFNEGYESVLNNYLIKNDYRFQNVTI